MDRQEYWRPRCAAPRTDRTATTAIYARLVDELADTDTLSANDVHIVGVYRTTAR